MKLRNLLMLIIPSLVLSSCAGLKLRQESPEEYEEIRELMEDALDEVPIEAVDYPEELKPLPILDEIDDESSESLIEFKEGDDNQYFRASLKDGVTNYVPTFEDVSLVDENDNEYPYELVYSRDGYAEYMVPVSSFSEDHQYHFKLNNNNLQFDNKIDSIRELTFYSLDVNENNRVRNIVRNSDAFTDFDISHVQYFDVDAYGAYFIYDEPFNLDIGKMFRISDLSIDGDTKDTTYGHLTSVSINPTGIGYLVRYNPCEGKDVYRNLNVNDKITLDDTTAENIETFADDESPEQTLGKAFLHHEDVITAMIGLMNHFNVSPRNFKKSAMDWASMLQVSFNIKFDGSTFSWGAMISLALNPEDNLTVKLSLSYQSTTRYDISASLSLDYTWFIPTGINYELKVEEDNTKVVQFKICIYTNLAPYDEDKIKEGIENDLIDAFTKDTDVKSKFAGDGPTASADGRSYPLIRFDCYYFFPLDIRFEIDFYWKLQITVEVDVTYTSHTQQTDISINNSKGCDPHSETKAQSDNNLSFNFMGTFHAEIGIKATLGIGISGFYKFFHAEVYITAYGAVDAQGFLIVDVIWGSEHDTEVIENAGGKFEVSCGVKWGVDIALLFGGFNFEWPIVTKVLVGFSNGNSIKAFTNEEETLNLTNLDYPDPIDLDNYHFLAVTVFNPQTFMADYVDMKHDDGATTRYGLWLDELKEQYFEYELLEGGEYITFEDYKVTIKAISGITSFDAKIKISVKDSLVVDRNDDVSKIVNIHFTNNLKEEILIKDQDSDPVSIGSYVIGTSMHLPVPNAPRYKKFVGWTNLSTQEFLQYNPDDPDTGKYTIPEITEPDQVTFRNEYVDWYYWNVVWVDGFGNIVKIEDVYNGEAATPPAASVRDRYMTSSDPNYEYVFKEYDQDYSSITHNTVIRAVYEYRKVGA